MTLGAAQITLRAGGWQIDRLPGPDLAALVTGRRVEEVANLLPRLFNLCRMAQTAALRLALGLGDPPDTKTEIIQDHRARIFVTLRRAFSLPPLRPAAILPPLPVHLSDLAPWLAGANPAAELGRVLRATFSQAIGVTSALPRPQSATPGAFENSPAGRQAGHPLLRAVERTEGRGPLWRYLGLLADLEQAAALPAPHRLADGTAIVQAARGSYALRLDQAGGLVTGLLRLTPTDHQLAPGGALSQALARVPGNRADLLGPLVALHDPCIPVTVPQVQHA